MRLDVDGLNVEFPYSRIYPEQHRLMRELKATLDANGQHALLEVPACIGRTVALLALYVAYWQAHPEVGKLVFACRTVCEIGKVLEILRLVVGPSNTVTGTGLPSRSMLEAATNARREAGLEDVAGDDEPLLQPGVNSLDAVTEVAMRSAGAGDVTDPGVVRNYGKLLLECAASVPDGVVVFFASFALMQSVLATWSKTDSKNGQTIDLLNGVTRHKLLFIESTDPAETAVALDHYKRACDVGRGAVFLGIARSKVAEAVEFDGHYGRAVIVLGFPFLDLRSRAAMARLEWLRDARGISEAEYLGMEAIRQAAQVIGQVVRGKTDYGVLLLVDRRYAEPKRRAHLPRWIAQFMERGDRRNLSTDVAVRLTKEYLREMPMEQVASVKESYAGACGWVGTGDAIAPVPEWHQSGARVVPMEIG